MCKILVWGFGNYYQVWKKYIPDEYEIIGFIHGDTKFKGKIFEEKKIYNPEEIISIDYDKIVIASGYKTKFIARLKNIGVPENKIEQLQPDFNGMLDKRKNSKSIQTYYGINENLGDLLNAFLPGHLFSIDTQWADLECAELLSIGSILNRIFLQEGMERRDKLLHIWGSGFMHSPRSGENEFYCPVQVDALRGRLSLELMEDIMGHDINCVLADPGLLCSKLGIQSVDKYYDIGIIPHYTEIDNPVFRKLVERLPNSVLINLRECPKDVLLKITSCKTILSNALHGLIISDSFLIPNRWIRIKKETKGNTMFKYWDYYSSYSGVEISPLIVNDEFDIRPNDIEQGYQITSQMVKEKQEKLIDSFPFT